MNRRYQPASPAAVAVCGLLDGLMQSVSGGPAVTFVRSLYQSMVRPAVAQAIDTDPDRVADLVIEYVSPFLEALNIRCAACDGQRWTRGETHADMA